MPRVAVYKPQIIDLLKSTPEGITTADIAETVGCSRQAVYKAINELGNQLKVIGKNETGAELWSWAEDYDVIGQFADLPRIGAIFHVVEMRKIDDKVRVTLKSEDGQELNFLS
jgi:predicted transcriptional regulator